MRKAWIVCNYKAFEECPSSQHEVINYNQNQLVDAITEATIDDELLQHYFAMDNVYADGEFDKSNVFE